MANGFEVEDHISASLKALAELIPQEAAKAALKAAVAGSTTLRRKVPKAKKVWPSDAWPGWDQPAEWIAVSVIPEGAQLDFRLFYGDLTNPVLRQAMEAAGQASRFERDQLQIHLRTPEAYVSDVGTGKGIKRSFQGPQPKGVKGPVQGPQRVVQFSEAPRLEQWAKDHYQYQRRAIIVDATDQLAPYLREVEQQARFSIYQDLSRIAAPVVAPKKIT